jgi:hypothetical protein
VAAIDYSSGAPITYSIDTGSTDEALVLTDPS